ncbi:MAG: nucleotidyltransferase domain-containing protein [Candidatus Odinarchaeota archaeon]
MTRSEIERALDAFAKKKFISSEHEKLVKRVETKCTELGYMVLEMGSAVKGTAIPGSDIDLLAIIPPGKEKFNPSNSLYHLKQLLQSPFNPHPGNHSLIIKENGLGVDVVPAKKTSTPDQYLIPSRRGNEWIKRGQDAFTNDFIKLDKKLNGRLSSAVKVLKSWNYKKTTLDLSGLSLEKIAYDALKVGDPPGNHVDTVIKCFKELKEQIVKNVKHPAGGPRLNKLSQSERENWKKVIEKDLVKLETFEREAWSQVLGFDI